MKTIILILLIAIPATAGQLDDSRYEHTIHYFDWLDDWSEAAADGMTCKEIKEFINQLSDHAAMGPLDCKWDCEAITLIDYAIETTLTGDRCDDARYGLPCVDRCRPGRRLINDLQVFKRIYCNWIQNGKNSGACLDSCKPCE